MREFITVDREVTAIRLRRTKFSGSFLLVEGGTDKTFYERFIDKVACQVVTTSGKPSSKQRAIEILGILGKDNFQGILAIVDADFDHLKGLPSIPNLIRTDTHDLETMLIQSPALDKVIAEIGSEVKIAQFSQDVRSLLLAAGKPIGYLLWISLLQSRNLTFSEIRFNKFIDEQNLKIDEIKLIQEVKNKSKNYSLKSEILQQDIRNQKRIDHDPWQICCGHHLVEILSLGLRMAIGSAKSSDVEPSVLELILRLAYEDAYFYETQIYLSIRQWESSNRLFRVLKNNI
jgi:hypothetical protein